jgi:hypothetical protein
MLVQASLPMYDTEAAWSELAQTAPIAAKTNRAFLITYLISICAGPRAQRQTGFSGKSIFRHPEAPTLGSHPLATRA